jgi:hypothetical protein
VAKVGATGGYRFDHRYQEVLALGDGTRVLVRLLRADDKELLRRAFERLSDDARYHRFFPPSSTRTASCRSTCR